jgi:hypothetical protein
VSVRHALAALLLLAGGAARAQDTDPAQLMARLEQRLLEARRVTVEATIEARGAIAVNLKGRSELRDRNRAELAWQGDFAGKPADLALKSDAATLQLRNGAKTREDGVGAESNRALLIGMARMGVLHNLARLTGLQAPDHAQAGVEQWVRLDSYRPTTFATGGDLEGTMSFGFDMVVAGTVGGSARLWLDPSTGLPRRRQVTVRFPQGDMVVLEDYTKFVVE